MGLSTTTSSLGPKKSTIRMFRYLVKTSNGVVSSAAPCCPPSRCRFLLNDASLSGVLLAVSGSLHIHEVPQAYTSFEPPDIEEAASRAPGLKSKPCTGSCN